VLDRTFVIEVGASSLDAWEHAPEAVDPTPWPVEAWTPRAVRLGELVGLTEAEQALIERAVTAVSEANTVLAPAGLGVGYRVRDEAALFVLHASETPDAFRTSTGAPVDPLDVALLTKLVPRIDGARSATGQAVRTLLAWAAGADDPDDVVEAWIEAGRPDALPSTPYPRTAARLARIVEGVLEDGVASFWA